MDYTHEPEELSLFFFSLRIVRPETAEAKQGGNRDAGDQDPVVTPGHLLRLSKNQGAKRGGDHHTAHAQTGDRPKPEASEKSRPDVKSHRIPERERALTKWLMFKVKVNHNYGAAQGFGADLTSGIILVFPLHDLMGNNKGRHLL